MSSEVYDPSEQDMIAGTFARLLRECTVDGGVKRKAGEKVAWDIDPSHEEHFWNHIAAWKNGNLKDKDSGGHPLQHAAWRLLAIAYQEIEDAKLPAHTDLCDLCDIEEDVEPAVYLGKGMHQSQAIDHDAEWRASNTRDYEAKWRALNGPTQAS